MFDIVCPPTMIRVPMICGLDIARHDTFKFESMKRFEPILILLTDKLESINVVPVFDDVYVPDVDVMEPITFKEP